MDAQRMTDRSEASLARAYLQAAKLQRIWDNESEERARCERLLAYAAGDQSRFIRTMPFETAHHLGSKPKFSPNILGLALRQLSYLYDEEPAREMQSGNEQAWAEERLWGFGMGLSNAMTYADTLTRLTDVCLAFAFYKNSPNAAREMRTAIEEERSTLDATHDGIEVVPFARNRFAVLSNEFDARVPVAALVHLLDRSEPGVGGLSNTTSRFAYWDEEVHGILERGTLGSWSVLEHTFEPHGVGCLPFAVMRNVEAGTDFVPSLGAWGGRDLEHNIRSVNELLSEYLWTAKLQRGQPVAKGNVENMVLAPDAVLQLETDGDFSIVSNAANLAGMREAAITALGLLAKSLGLPSRSLKIDDAGAMSGVAIALDRAELADDRRARVKIATAWERSIHAIAAKVYGAKRGLAISGDVSVQFQEPLLTLTLTEKREQVAFELAHGLISPLRAVMTLHPELTEAEAQARVDEANPANDDTEGAESISA